jgi:SAM-dependent methyltransferase
VAPRAYTPAVAARGALRENEDAYGRILLAVLEGRTAHEIMERDDGLVYCGDPRDYFAPYRRWPAVERRAMRFVRGRVLDVGCGAGRVALHLQERGHDVVAIDESPLAVEVARRRGVKTAEVRSLARVDRSLGVFGTVLLIRNNFGLAGPAGRTPHALRRLSGVTDAGGRIITDSVHPDRVDPDLPPYRPPGGGSAVRRGPRFRVRWQRHATPWFRYLMLAPPDLERLLAGTGWRLLRVIDDGSPRYAAVIEKDTTPEGRSRPPLGGE